MKSLPVCLSVCVSIYLSYLPSCKSHLFGHFISPWYNHSRLTGRKTWSLRQSVSLSVYPSICLIYLVANLISLDILFHPDINIHGWLGVKHEVSTSLSRCLCIHLSVLFTWWQISSLCRHTMARHKKDSGCRQRCLCLSLNAFTGFLASPLSALRLHWTATSNSTALHFPTLTATLDQEGMTLAFDVGWLLAVAQSPLRVETSGIWDSWTSCLKSRPFWERKSASSNFYGICRLCYAIVIPYLNLSKFCTCTM